MKNTTNNTNGNRNEEGTMATAEAIERQNEEWAAQAKWEAEMAAERATRMANRGTGRVAARGWGANGVRYDEACGGCGTVTEIDNITEFCRACGK